MTDAADDLIDTYTAQSHASRQQVRERYDELVEMYADRLDYVDGREWVERTIRGLEKRDTLGERLKLAAAQEAMEVEQRELFGG